MFPVTGLRLLLPAIVPSWRFFDAVGASPRLDYALLPNAGAPGNAWQEFRPRVAMLTPLAMLLRLFWNPVWNENLYLVSLAERLIQAPGTQTAAHSEREMLLRVARHLGRQGANRRGWLHLRLRLVARIDKGAIEDRTVWLSQPCLLGDGLLGEGLSGEGLSGEGLLGGLPGP